jgi:YD repeat-containing protein
LIAIVALSVLLCAWPTGARADVTYVYDELERLVRVVREDGEAATYAYDAVGNLLGITRSSGVPLGASVTSSPGPLGRSNTVTLTLDGFNLLGATASGSTGLTVTAVQDHLDRVTLTVAVAGDAPLGAGSVTIDTPYGTVVVPVTIQNGITVSSMVPTTSVPGTIVTLTGSNFDPTPSNNTVRINGTAATVVAASATSLKFQVPVSATSGPVDVATSSAAGVAPTLLVVRSMPAGRSQVPTDGLLAYWTFEVDGRDDAGSFDLALQGGLANTADGALGAALEFPNDASKIAAREADASAFNFGGGDFSVAVWARWASVSGEQVLLDKCDNMCAGPGWTLTKLSNQTLLLHPLVQTGANAVVAGQWYHIAVVREGSTARLYLNGTQAAQASGIGSIAASSAPLWIGERVGPQTFPMNGGIDEVGVWTRALTATEVAALAVAPPPGAPIITAMTPTRAIPGMVLAIQGTDFDQGTPQTPVVNVNGVQATVLETKGARVKVRVPAGATTGPVTVTTSLGTGMSAQDLVIQSLGASRSTVPTTDLIAYWTLDEDGRDGAGSLDLTLQGGLATITPARLTAGLRFTKDASKIAVRPDNDAALNFGATDFTMALWVKWSSLDGEQVMVDKCDNACASIGWSLTKLSNHSVLFAPLVQSSASAVVAGQWYHLAVTRDGSTARIYLDGSQIAQATVGTIPVSMQPVWLGERAGAQTFPLNGVMDEVAIWGRALSATEIQALASIP